MATPHEAAADDPVRRDVVLAAWVRDARRRTMEVVEDLSDEQLLGPQLRIVNPLLWEIVHGTWFQEKWALRHAGGEAPMRADSDSLYDSAAIPHDTRWNLRLPSRDDTLAYMRAVRDRVLERIEQGNLTESDRYFITLAVFHEDMHTEAFTYTRQTHGWSAPVFSGLEPGSSCEGGPLGGDVEIAGRRLPTELEWEVAAAGESSDSSKELAGVKRRFPWGDDSPRAEHANLGWRAMGTVDVGAMAAGDSAFGCRQMIGNVWEWTADDFAPYPGFEVDPYREYSEPWFGTHKALRGGAWPTQPRLLRNTWRNFYTPDRRDVWAGFRTCQAPQ